MKKKYKPGPWHAGGFLGTSIFDETSERVCTISYLCGDCLDEKTEANNRIAKMMAAAPEMLEALHSCISLIKELGVTDGDAVREAKSAIQKATL